MYQNLKKIFYISTCSITNIAMQEENESMENTLYTSEPYQISPNLSLEELIRPIYDNIEVLNNNIHNLDCQIKESLKKIDQIIEILNLKIPSISTVQENSFIKSQREESPINHMALPIIANLLPSARRPIIENISISQSEKEKEANTQPIIEEEQRINDEDSKKTEKENNSSKNNNLSIFNKIKRFFQNYNLDNFLYMVISKFLEKCGFKSILLVIVILSFCSSVFFGTFVLLVISLIFYMIKTANIATNKAFSFLRFLPNLLQVGSLNNNNNIRNHSITF